MRSKQGQVEVSGGFLLTSAALFYLDTENILPWVFLACVIHELGHCGAVRALGGRILVFRLTAVGGELVLDQRWPLSYGRELLAILAGPAANLLTALLLSIGGTSGFVGLSLALGLFNLLPIWPLDGGRILSILLTVAKVGPLWELGGRICSIVCTAALLMLGGAAFFRGGGNFSLLAVALWLTLGLAKRMKASM